MPFPLQPVTDGDWNTLRRNTDATSRRLNPILPQARVFNDANISVANNTVAALTFNSERYDSGDLHSTSVNTGRLTAPITGLYAVGACVSFASNATGIREVELRVNGTTVIAIDDRPANTGAVTVISIDTQYRLAATDYVEVLAFQNSGGALNVLVSASYSPEFWMTRLGGYVNMGVN